MHCGSGVPVSARSVFHWSQDPTVLPLGNRECDPLVRLEDFVSLLSTTIQADLCLVDGSQGVFLKTRLRCLLCWVRRVRMDDLEPLCYRLALYLCNSVSAFWCSCKDGRGRDDSG